MKSFPTVAFVLAAISTVSVAAPAPIETRTAAEISASNGRNTGGERNMVVREPEDESRPIKFFPWDFLDRREMSSVKREEDEKDFFVLPLPIYYNQPASTYNNANGGAGGSYDGGRGGNGGYIRARPNSNSNANGGTGGHYNGGSGGNGGTISRREADEESHRRHRHSRRPTSNDHASDGTTGDHNGGVGGGAVTVVEREEDDKEFKFFWPIQPGYPAYTPGNGGFMLNRREEEDKNWWVLSMLPHYYNNDQPVDAYWDNENDGTASGSYYYTGYSGNGNGGAIRRY